MIDHFALALGHGLMAVALLRLAMHTGLDTDPVITEIAAEADGKRKAASAASRNAARRDRQAPPDVPGPRDA